MMLPDEGRFPLLVHDRHFVVLYQRGELNPFRSRWTRSDTGSEYLVVCPCGRGTHARYLDDAIAALRSSYILHDDGSHEHDESAFPCNIIEATQDGEHGFIVGRIVVPELVDYFNFHPNRKRDSVAILVAPLSHPGHGFAARSSPKVVMSLTDVAC